MGELRARAGVVRDREVVKEANEREEDRACNGLGQQVGEHDGATDVLQRHNLG